MPQAIFILPLKHVLLFLFFFCALQIDSYSQEQHQTDDELYEEIMNFRNEDLKVLNNGRLMLMRLLKARNLSKMASVYDLVLERSQNHADQFLTPGEHLLLLAILGREETYLYELVKQGKTTVSTNWHLNDLIVRDVSVEPNYSTGINRTDLMAFLGDYVNEVMAQLLATANQVLGSDEDRAIFALSLGHLVELSGHESLDFGFFTGGSYRGAYVEEAFNFLEQYPTSRYADYVKTQIGQRKGLSDWGVGADLGFGPMGYTDSLSAMFENSWGFDFGLDLSFRSLLLQMRINGFTSRISDTIMIEGVRWFRNERAVYNAFSMDLAYKVKVGRLFLSPFVGVSINSIGHLNRQELRELERSRFRATGAWQYGLNLEYAFQKVSRKGPFPNEAYPYLRLRGLRRDVQMDRRYEGLEGGNWYLGLSFGFYFREFTTYE